MRSRGGNIAKLLIIITIVVITQDGGICFKHVRGFILWSMCGLLGGKGNHDFKTSNLQLETSGDREQSWVHLLGVLGCSGLWAQGFILSSNENRSAQKPSVKNQPES